VVIKSPMKEATEVHRGGDGYIYLEEEDSEHGFYSFTLLHAGSGNQ
jgi:hypothetical protein